jgi:hypothetical protein
MKRLMMVLITMLVMSAAAKEASAYCPPPYPGIFCQECRSGGSGFVCWWVNYSAWCNCEGYETGCIEEIECYW